MAVGAEPLVVWTSGDTRVGKTLVATALRLLLARSVAFALAVLEGGLRTVSPAVELRDRWGARMTSGATSVRHLYVHLPFCAHRCGYCDFVTVVGRPGQHEIYADALLAELERERAVLADPVETVFVGGGTPTFTEPDALLRILTALPAASEVTVEANPETVTARARHPTARRRCHQDLPRCADVLAASPAGTRSRCRT